MVSYLDGDYRGGCGHNRQVDIHFMCDNDRGAYGIPDESRSELDYSLNTGARGRTQSSTQHVQSAAYMVDGYKCFSGKHQVPGHAHKYSRVRFHLLTVYTRRVRG